jgi:hypothetical protein
LDPNILAHISDFTIGPVVEPRKILPGLNSEVTRPGSTGLGDRILLRLPNLRLSIRLRRQ